MKTYTSEKPYYIITRAGKYVAGSKIVIGRNVVTEDQVEWFDDEVSYKARLSQVKPDINAATKK